MNNKTTSFLIEKGLIQKEDVERVLTQPLENISIEGDPIHSELLDEGKFRSVSEEFFGVPFTTKDDSPEEIRSNDVKK